MYKNGKTFKNWLFDNKKEFFFQYAGENHYFGFKKDIVRKFIEIVPRHNYARLEETLKDKSINKDQEEKFIWRDVWQLYFKNEESNNNNNQRMGPTLETDDIDTFDDFDIESDYLNEVIQDFLPIKDQKNDDTKKEKPKEDK